MHDKLHAALQARQEAGLYRSRRQSDSAQGPHLHLDGKDYLAFCSNDYLGLAAHPDIRAALIKGVETWGVGSGAAHLVCGHTRAHHALEEELAEFTGRERALLFSTGYMANIGAVCALVGRGDAVFEDRLNHASLLDAGLLSGARFRRFSHADTNALAAELDQANYEQALVVTDGVFSMDGDIAPLSELATTARDAHAWLLVDDAHGLGVLGREGKGCLDTVGLGQDDVPLLVGTLGKAFGTAGAFVAGSEDMIETLVQQARTYIYTTAQPPALAEATRASLKLVRAADDRREKLSGLVQRFRQGAGQLGIRLSESRTAIQPLIVGSSQDAMELAQHLEDHGVLVTAIRPPTVPEGSARLRITFSAAHEPEHVDRLLDALEAVHAS